jgi:hypothetical protein
MKKKVVLLFLCITMSILNANGGPLTNVLENLDALKTALSTLKTFIEKKPTEVPLSLLEPKEIMPIKSPEIKEPTKKIKPEQTGKMIEELAQKLGVELKSSAEQKKPIQKEPAAKPIEKASKEEFPLTREKPLEIKIPERFIDISKFSLVMNDPSRHWYQLRILPHHEKDLKKTLADEIGQSLPKTTSAQQRNALIKAAEKHISADNENSGYHALKNSLVMLNTFLSPENQRSEVLQELLSASWYVNFLMATQPIVINLRKEKMSEVPHFTPKASWITGPEIEYLLSLPEMKGIVLSNKDPMQYITILDNFERLIDEGTLISERYAKIIEDFRKKSNFQHIFIIGYKKKFIDAPLLEAAARGSGEWIAIAINKVNGNVQYLIMDSENKPRKEEIAQFIRIIKDMPFDELEVRGAINGHIKALANAYATINDLFNARDYKTARGVLRQVLYRMQQIMKAVKGYNAHQIVVFKKIMMDEGVTVYLNTIKNQARQMNITSQELNELNTFMQLITK